ncbi:hypothetical protein HK101_000991 [Irineochytrium annulatum]|nr:hypothetical protein HK101_000991 [Irineochytrium annulatum]
MDVQQVADADPSRTLLRKLPTSVVGGPGILASNEISPLLLSGGMFSTPGDAFAMTDVGTWSSQDVARWLEDKLQLREAIVNAFKGSGVDEAWLSTLTDEDLSTVMGLSEKATLWFRAALERLPGGTARDESGSTDFIVRVIERGNGITWDYDTTINAGQSVRWHNEVIWIVASVHQQDQPNACAKSSQTVINVGNFTASFSDAVVFRTPGTYYWYLDPHSVNLPPSAHQCIEGAIMVLGPPAPEASTGSVAPSPTTVPSTTTVHFGNAGVLNQSVTITEGDSVQWQGDVPGSVYQEDGPGQCKESRANVTIAVNNIFIGGGVSNAIVFAVPGIYYWFVTKSIQNNTIVPCTSSSEGAITVLPLSTTAVNGRGSPPAGAIAGIVLASVIVAGLLAAGATIWIRKRRAEKAARKLGEDVGPVDLIQPSAAEVTDLEISVPYESPTLLKPLPSAPVDMIQPSAAEVTGLEISVPSESPTLLKLLPPARVASMINLPVRPSGGENPTLGHIVALPDVAAWSTEDVACWLEDKLLLRPQIVALFRDGDVNGTRLMAMTDEDLSYRLGLTSVDSRQMFRVALGNLTGSAAASGEGGEAPPPYLSRTRPTLPSTMSSATMPSATIPSA